MFDVNLINEPGMQDAGINKKLSYHVEDDKGQKKDITATLNSKDNNR